MFYWFCKRRQFCPHSAFFLGYDGDIRRTLLPEILPLHLLLHGVRVQPHAPKSHRELRRFFSFMGCSFLSSPTSVPHPAWEIICLYCIILKKKMPPRKIVFGGRFKNKFWGSRAFYSFRLWGAGERWRCFGIYGKENGNCAKNFLGIYV